jgi:hypothetical protein
MEERQRKAATLELIKRSMGDIDAGRTRPARQALCEVAANLGLSLDR